MSEAVPLTIPFGWYQVAWSDGLPAGSVESLRAFGLDWVVFRNESGQVGVLDAYCLHLGAHLGEGGTVDGDGVRCPFHGWRWAPDGRCQSIPYAKRIPAGAITRSLPVHERFGMVFCWFHPEGAAPLFELPEVPQWGAAGWPTTWTHREIELSTHPQEIAENGPDWRHLGTVHGMEMSEDAFVFEPEGYGYRWYLGGRVAEGDSTLQGMNYGMGISTFEQGGVHDAVVLTTVLPIEANRLLFRLAMLSRAAPSEREAQFAFHWEFAAPDFAIWEHKIHRSAPLLCEEDGPIARFRAWAARFY
jgi:phenylpropionate dioxygenase-like ring-hydroxylating dioxygenase large terminal subunit